MPLWLGCLCPGRGAPDDVPGPAPASLGPQLVGPHSLRTATDAGELRGEPQLPNSAIAQLLTKTCIVAEVYRGEHELQYQAWYEPHAGQVLAAAVSIAVSPTPDDAPAPAPPSHENIVQRYAYAVGTLADLREFVGFTETPAVAPASVHHGAGHVQPAACSTAHSREVLVNTLAALAERGPCLHVVVTEWCEGGDLHSHLRRLQLQFLRTKRPAPIDALSPAPQPQPSPSLAASCGTAAPGSVSAVPLSASRGDFVRLSELSALSPPQGPSRLASKQLESSQRSLQHLFARPQSLRQEQAVAQVAAVQAALDVARGVAALHAAGLTHGRLEPRTVLCATYAMGTAGGLDAAAGAGCGPADRGEVAPTPAVSAATPHAREQDHAATSEPLPGPLSLGTPLAQAAPSPGMRQRAWSLGNAVLALRWGARDATASAGSREDSATAPPGARPRADSQAGAAVPDAPDALPPQSTPFTAAAAAAAAASGNTLFLAPRTGFRRLGGGSSGQHGAAPSGGASTPGSGSVGSRLRGVLSGRLSASGPRADADPAAAALAAPAAPAAPAGGEQLSDRLTHRTAATDADAGTGTLSTWLTRDTAASSAWASYRHHQPPSAASAQGGSQHISDLCAPPAARSGRGGGFEARIPTALMQRAPVTPPASGFLDKLLEEPAGITGVPAAAASEPQAAAAAVAAPAWAPVPSPQALVPGATRPRAGADGKGDGGGVGGGGSRQVLPVPPRRFTLKVLPPWAVPLGLRGAPHSDIGDCGAGGDGGSTSAVPARTSRPVVPTLQKGSANAAAAAAPSRGLSYNTAKWQAMAYAAPEALAELVGTAAGNSGAPAPPVGPAADVYSLGALLWQLVSGGRPPHYERHPAQILMGLLSGDLDLALEWPEDVDPELAELGRACMRREPDSRPSAQEVEEALAALLSRLGPEANPAQVLLVA
ncbi:hypothetical protein HYH03_017722 [Edaphochlamys debaryana]|uniref:Serine-threonine/tyrosine-protein kinase catalytic domain-containing protein n=1 Tax=Edaphochlamys debaryana TaxID=47281 RepID=A0A836BNV8_9CHLO|nr:hypothetical protein HYH03_017722 [Edaphochlamys debaryana]|eukprot:KAG2483415.1 hypothetical protein HYH03_017722 [Edaphochlamys debaryana]